MGEKPTSKNVEAGRRAKAQGLPPTACPYPRGTPQAKEWLRGWQEAA